MKYEIELSHEIEQRLLEKANATGSDVAHLIQIAVGQFVGGEAAPDVTGVWTELGEARRRTLIDKDIEGSITPDELVELNRLDRLANEHFDQIAPPPFEGARRLHAQLIRKHGTNGH